MAKGSHKPKSLKTRREVYEQQRLTPQQGFRKPGSLKK